jgi:hypothetical protein
MGSEWDPKIGWLSAGSLCMYDRMLQSPITQIPAVRCMPQPVG